jgi:recombination protein RecA
MGSYAEIISKCAKDWGCPDLMESVNKVGGKKIPFSSPSLNWATYGGVPRGALTEFYGYPGGGKSSTAIDVGKNALDIFLSEYSEEVMQLQEQASAGKKEAKVALQDLKDRGPKRVLYVDLEHSFDRKWAATLGIANKDIGVMQPPDVAAEKILQSIEDLVATGEVGFIVLDSIPSLVPQAELEKKYGERTVAALAGLMTQFCRKITQLLMRYDCTMIFINQLRVNMQNPFADNTPGGEAIKFYTSLRMKFSLGSPLDFLGNELPLKAENPAGYKISVKLIKQKSAPFDRKLAEYYLMAQSGLRIDFEFASLAITKYSIIRKNQGWFTICDPETSEPLEVDGSLVKINGLAKVYDYLQTHPDYYEKLCNFIINDINKNGLEIESSDDIE